MAVSVDDAVSRATADVVTGIELDKQTSDVLLPTSDLESLPVTCLPWVGKAIQAEPVPLQGTELLRSDVQSSLIQQANSCWTILNSPESIVGSPLMTALYNPMGPKYEV